MLSGVSTSELLVFLGQNEIKAHKTYDKKGAAAKALQSCLNKLYKNNTYQKSPKKRKKEMSQLSRDKKNA